MFKENTVEHFYRFKTAQYQNFTQKMGKTSWCRCLWYFILKSFIFMGFGTAWCIKSTRTYSTMDHLQIVRAHLSKTIMSEIHAKFWGELPLSPFPQLANKGKVSDCNTERTKIKTVLADRDGEGRRSPTSCKHAWSSLLVLWRKPTVYITTKIIFLTCYVRYVVKIQILPSNWECMPLQYGLHF
jgi:hypothetical protein